MTNALPAHDYAPLDPDEYKRQATLLKAQHCAHPVMLGDREHFIHTLSVEPVGGRIGMTAYLMGDPTPYDSAQIKIAARPT